MKMAKLKASDRHDDKLDVKLLLKTLVAFQHGNFSVRMPNDWTGVNGKVADTLNEIIEMAERVTGDYARVSQVVGKAGKINDRLLVTGLHGSWAKLVDSSNVLIEDLISPLSEMVRVINAVSIGDLSQSVPTVVNDKKLRGQFLKSAEMVNGMVSWLVTFSSEVTRVAREVGTEGKLGAHKVQVSQVPGKILYDNVNQLAANFTSQVRAIAGVATAVTKGDLTRSVMVEAKGEVADSKIMSMR